MQLIILASGRGSRLNYKIKVPKIFVKIKNQTIFDLNSKFYSFFKKKIIVLGYGYQNCKKILKNRNIKIVRNTHYYKTNMVHSLFCAKNFINDDILVCYGDIFFDWQLIKELINTNNKKNIIILKKNWLSFWKKRMSMKHIYKDAEDVKIIKNKLLQIGKKIKYNLPKYQFMGIIKFKRSSFLKLSRFYIKLENKNIDFTSFLNQAIEKKVIDINVITTNKYWFEIDNKKDLKILKNFINDKKII